MNIKFLRGLFEAYKSLATKDANTLYFVTDTGALYLGEKLIGKDYDASILALQNLIGEVPEGYASLRAYVDSIVTGSGYVTVSIMEAAIKAEADRAKGIEEGLRTDVDTIKADYLKAADIANFETKENVKKVADDLAAYVTSNDAALAELTGKVGAVEEGKTVVGLIGENTTAIEGLDGRIGVAEGEIDALQEQIQGLSGAMHFKGTYDEIPVGLNIIQEGAQLVEGKPIYFDTGLTPTYEEFERVPVDTNEYGYGFLLNYRDPAAETSDIRIVMLEDQAFYFKYMGDNSVIYVSEKVTDEKLQSLGLSHRGWQKESVICNATTTADLQMLGSASDELGYYPYFLVEGVSSDFVAGDVIAVGDKEYVFNGSAFVEFGDISAEGERLTALEEKVGEKTVAEQVGEAKTYADGLNTAMDTRVKVLEGIDHEAYVAADAALKTELEGKIADGDAATLEAAKADAANKSTVVLAESQKYTDTAKAEAIADADGKVTALAEGQVTTNKNDIAGIVEMLTWGEF